MTSADVAVLGGGPAGVAAAWWAARTGRSVVLVERSGRLGGLAASIEVAGQRVDLGSHRLHPSTDPAILSEVRSLLGDDLQERPRNGRIRLQGRWLRFPLQPADLLRHTPRSLATRFARDLATAPLRRPRADTFAELARAGPGPAMAEAFYLPYARKLFGVDPEELAGEAFRRRVATSRASALVRRALGRGGARTFFSPRRGFGQITEAMADAAAACGAELRTGWDVAAVASAAGGVVVTAADGATLDAGVVLSTIPIARLALACTGVPADIAAAASAIRSRGALLAYFLVDRPRWSSFDAHYLPEPLTPVSRISEPKNYRDGDDPPDRTVLCAEVPADPTQARWQLGHAALGDELAASLDRAGVGLDAPCVHVERVGALYPVATAERVAALDAVDEWLSQQERLLTFGRQGLAVHDNTHHAWAMARAAVGCLTPEGWDRRRWAQARSAFAAHVVED